MQAVLEESARTAKREAAMIEEAAKREAALKEEAAKREANEKKLEEMGEQLKLLTQAILNKNNE